MKRALVLSLALAIAGCGGAERDALQGYGEADYLFVASQETGVVRDIAVREGEHVSEGQRLFILDPERLSYGADTAVAQAEAARQAVRTAQAEATLAARNYARGLELYERGFYPRARLDTDRAARDAANARLAQARREATAADAATSLAQERVSDLDGVAPADATVEQIFHRPGEVVPAGQPIVALLPPQNMKVRFFAPQAMLPRLPVGARVLVDCDGCEEPIAAIVSFVAREPQFTPPVIYSLEERDKLVFLVEARLSRTSPIRPGMPVDVRLAQ